MCNIQNIQLTSQNFDAQGFISRLVVDARVDCPSVNIEVRRHADDLHAILSETNVGGTTVNSVAGEPPNLVAHTFDDVGGLGIRCGDLLNVRIICTDDPSCRRGFNGELTKVECKGFAGSECPATVILSVAPPVDQNGDCVAAGNYSVTVLDPVGADVTYFWSAGPVGSPQAMLPGSSATQIIQVHGGDPQTVVTVIAIKPGCPPPTGTVLFPAGDDVQCPTGFSVVVVQGATAIAGPHANTQGVDWNVPAVASGTYTVRITQPTGAGASYEWFDNDGTLAATGASNEHAVTVNAGQATTTSFHIKPSDCCPPMAGSVTLTGSATATPPATPTPTPETPATPTPTPEPPSGFDLCALLRLIAGVALIAALLSIVATGCIVLVPTAIPTLIGALVVAVAAAILVLLICRPSLCRVIGVLVWALKWSIVLGALIAIGCGSIVSAFIVALYGGLVAALIWLLISMHCRIPRMLSMP